MDNSRWKQVQTLFHGAAGLPESGRHAFLQAAAHNDQSLIGDVLALLAADARVNSLLDQDVARIAHQLLEPEIAPLPPFRELGPYRLGRVLGHGGMGVVYLAEREDIASVVAIKVLRDAWLSPARRRRFATEQRTLAQLNHPSIARLYDADTLTDGTPCFVMEYVEGVSLVEYCVRQQSTMPERLRLFRSVCEAVQYAHSRAVIHRDLKPSNILVKDDGAIRLLDFGIARHLESMGESVDHTLTALRLMTPAYAAPEQIRGQQAGIQTDVYALGVILYELLSGQLPFDLSNQTPAQAEKTLLEEEPQKPSRLAVVAAPESSRRVPHASKAAWADLDVMCLTAMHKDPQRRYSSVEALLRDLNHYLNGQPLEARSDSLRYTLGKFVRRNQRAVAAAAAVLTIITALVVFYTVRLTKARNAALAEAARTQRIQRFMLNLFQGGDEAAGPPDDLRVATLMDRGVREAVALSSEPDLQAELYQTLGGIYQRLGKLDRADSLLRSALDQRRARFGPNSREVAESLVALGLLRADQAQMEEAERLIREGLAMAKHNLPPAHPAVAAATFALGKVLEDRGAYVQAIQTLEEAVRLQSASGQATTDLAASLSELANSHFYAGHYDVSESLNRRVLAMQRGIYGDRHPLIADTLINLGAIQFERGNYQQAEQFDRQALEITLAWYGNDHPETASALTILGRALIPQGRGDEAADSLRHALAIEEHVYGKVHPHVASTLNELGTVAMKQGKLDESEADFSRAVDIYRSVYSGKHYYIGIALSNLGSVCMERKDYSRAERFYRQALEMFSQTLPPQHPNAGVTRIKLGRALLRQYHYSEAEAQSRPGYEIVARAANPSVRWLQSARQDLAEEYGALDQPEKAARFRSELTALNGRASDPSTEH